MAAQSANGWWGNHRWVVACWQRRWPIRYKDGAHFVIVLPVHPGRGHGHMYAYNLGGSTSPNFAQIVIRDFGCQELSGFTGSVKITDTYAKSQRWVETAAKDFAAGWSSDHSSSLVLAIGANNDDVGYGVVARRSGNHLGRTGSEVLIQLRGRISAMSVYRVRK